MGSKFLEGEALRIEIKKVVQSNGAICVVAFVGQGASDWLTENLSCKLLCNLTSGATNPNEIKELIKFGVEVRHCEHLHAKVYVCAESCIVSSANLSANGLGLEAAEQGHWTEVGVLHNAIDGGAYVECRKWVLTVWDEADEVIVNGDLIKLARKNWLRNQKSKPQLQSQKNLNLDDLDGLPTVSYCGLANIELSQEGQAKLGKKELDESIFFSCDFDDLDKDGDFLKQGRWILLFQMNIGCKNYSRKVKPYWVFVDEVIPNGLCRDGNENDLIHVALGTKNNRQPPIEIPKAWRKWVTVYEKICGSDDFNQENSEKPIYFAGKRRKLNQEFWQEIAKL